MLYVNPLEVAQSARTSQALAGAGREKQAVQEFERFFLYTLLREMRKTVPNEGLFGDNQSREVYEEMLDDHLAGQMAASGQIGIGKQIEAQLRVSEKLAETDLTAYKSGLPLRPAAAEFTLHRESAGMALPASDTSSLHPFLPINQSGRFTGPRE